MVVFILTVVFSVAAVVVSVMSMRLSRRTMKRYDRLDR